MLSNNQVNLVNDTFVSDQISYYLQKRNEYNVYDNDNFPQVNQQSSVVNTIESSSDTSSEYSSVIDCTQERYITFTFNI